MGPIADKASMKDRMLGLLRVRVLRGVDLAVRDYHSSDPYVIVSMGKQKLKTRVVKRNLNPEWNEELTLSVEEPSLPIKLEVYDKDWFSFDDPMGSAEVDIRPLFEAVKMNHEGLADGSVITKLIPSRRNCFAEESLIYLKKGSVLQDMFLRLKNVERGEIELQLLWIRIPNARSISLEDYLLSETWDPCGTQELSCYGIGVAFSSP